MSLRQAICEYYDIDSGITHNRVNQDIIDAFLESNLIDSIERKIGQITDHCLSSDSLPPRGLHNFLNSKSESISVRSYSNSKVAPKLVGQCGSIKFNEFFGHLSKDIIDTKNVKSFLHENTAEVFEIMLDYLFCSDWNVFIHKLRNNSFEIFIIPRSQFELYQFNSYGLRLTRDLKSWNESTTIKRGRDTLGEFQIHTNRLQPKLRINPEWIINELKEDLGSNSYELNANDREQLYSLTFTELISTENNAFGNSCEKALAEVFELHYDGPNNFVQSSLPLLKEHYAGFEINEPLKEYVGSSSRERGGLSRSGTDFITESGKTLSLKSNKSKNGKICPSEIGQPSPQTFDLHFQNSGMYSPPITPDKFRELVTNSKHCAFLLHKYLDYTFECDYLLWTYLEEEKINSILLHKQDFIGFSFTETAISFTNPFVDKDSTTVKYHNISIGEFQLSHSRNSLKFRFFIKNLIKAINIQKS